MIIPGYTYSVSFKYLIIFISGHKRHCKFRYCDCQKCIEIKERQEYMADMQYIKRNGIAEEARLGKRADMIAIYNERMKNKNKKKITGKFYTLNSITSWFD